MDVSSFMGGNFLTHVDLPIAIQTWTIAKVDQQMVGQGAQAEEKICVTFSEFRSKPLSMNKTNLKRIVRIYTTDATEWIGRQVLVYRSQTTYGSDMVLCVRVNTPGTVPPLNENRLPEPILEKNGLPYVPQQSAPAQLAAQPVTSPMQAPVAVASQPGPAVQNTATADTQAAPGQPPVAPPQPVAQPVTAPWESQNNSPPGA